MLHSTWPRLPSAAKCCCPRGARLYSGHSSDRTLPDRPNFGTTPRTKIWSRDRRNKPKQATPRPIASVQRQQQAERNWRKKLVEGRPLPKEQTVAALMEDFDLLEITDAEIEGINETEFESTAKQKAKTAPSTEPENDGGLWSLLRRRQRSAETENPTGSTQALNGSETITASAEKWPLLKRREPSYRHMETVHTTLEDSRNLETLFLDDSTELIAEPPEDSIDLVQATREALARKDDHAVSKSHTMIRIDGLSTDVHASDFYRIAETDLSRWNQSIKKVQQVRDRMTLEPTGTYHITFSTAMAATAYAARFQRLHALAQVKARSKTGLWQSEVPPALRPPPEHDAAAATQDRLETELAQLSIAPGMQAVTLEHRRVAAGPEGHKIRSLVAHDGHGERPAVVLLDVTPPPASPERVRDAIRQHGQRARGSWGLVSRAHPVAGNLQRQLQRLTADFAAAAAEHDDVDAMEMDEAQRQQAEKQRNATLRKREGLRRVAQHMEGAALRRFVVAFRDVAEAQRFHRLWNGRWLGGHDTPPPAAGAARHFVRTQVLEY